MKLLRQNLRAELIYVYSDTNLEDNLIQCPASKIIVTGPPLGPINSQPWFFRLVCSTRHEFHLGEWAYITFVTP